MDGEEGGGGGRRRRGGGVCMRTHSVDMGFAQRRKTFFYSVSSVFPFSHSKMEGTAHVALVGNQFWNYCYISVLSLWRHGHCRATTV